VAFCLLPNRKSATYNDLFERFKQQTLSMNKQFNPKRIVSDFESELRSAIKHNVFSVSLYTKLEQKNLLFFFSFQQQFILAVSFTLTRRFIGILLLLVLQLIMLKTKIFVLNAVI
jgi:hypothetical protein